MMFCRKLRSTYGMSVYAFDGSKYDLPATEQIRKEFESKSGLNHSGIDNGNERENAKTLFAAIFHQETFCALIVVIRVMNLSYGCKTTMTAIFFSVVQEATHFQRLKNF